MSREYSNGETGKLKNTIGKLSSMKRILNELFVERDKEITALLAGLVSGEPVILVGPPGTGKTRLIEYLSKLTRSKYFYYLLTRFTEPDEIFGPINISAFREGRYERIIKNRLPDSEIVFLDEIFRASSAIRNILLDIILYKRVLNGEEYIKLPLLAFYTATNEVSHDQEDQGFYDRMTIRNFHSFTSIERWKELLHKGLYLQTEPPVPQVLSSEEIKLLQEEVSNRALRLRENSSVINKYIEALGELKNLGITLSDRRKVKTLLVASAISMVYQEENVSLDSIADAIRYTAPYDQDDLQKIEEAIVRSGLSSYEYRLRQIHTLKTELTNILNRTISVPTDANLRALDQVIDKSLTIIEQSMKSKRLEDAAKELEDIVRKAIEFREKSALS